MRSAIRKHGNIFLFVDRFLLSFPPIFYASIIFEYVKLSSAGSLIVLLLPIGKELYVDLYAYRFYFSTSFKMNSKNVGSMCGQTIKAP